MNRSIGPRRRSGVTLTELLAVLVIIGLLATLALPQVINRVTQSKFATARAEVKALADGEQAVGMTHGFYVPLQLLDNVAVDRTTQDLGVTDDLQNEATTIQLIDVNVSVLTQDTFGQARLDPFSTDPRVREMFRNWQGPFATFQRVHIGGNFEDAFSLAQIRLTSTQTRRDFPLDPWGRPYRFYSPIGIIGSTIGVLQPATAQEIDTDGFSDGNLTNFDDRFDRFAIVSFGPDGRSDRTTTSGGTSGVPLAGDDIIYLFGSVVPRQETLIILDDILGSRRAGGRAAAPTRRTAR